MASVAAELRAGATAPDGDAPAPDALIDAAERFAEADLSALQALTVEDLASVADLLFGLVSDFRGPHWQLPAKSAARIGKWMKRSLERHTWGKVLEEWLPEVMCLALIAYEVSTRLRIDRQVAAARAAAAREEGDGGE